MTYDPCDPCSCINGNMYSQTFYQKAIQLLCKIASALGALGETLSYSYLNLSTTGQVIKSSAGYLEGYYFSNSDLASPVYVKVYDQATAPSSSDTPKLRYMIPAGGGANLDNINLPFTNGISIRACTGAADNDNTAPSSNQVIVNVYYK